MNRRLLVVVVALIAICLGGFAVAAAWYFVSPLFLDREVAEEFPATPSEPDAMATAAAMPDQVMNEEMPVGGEPVAVRIGRFMGADSFHQGAGTATIYTLPDGSRLLRLDEFSVTNGPDLHVLLATGESPTSQDDLGQYVDLGSLKGNIGSQNYEIPAEVDPASFGSVVIYCLPFHVVFATATLE